MTEKEKMIAGKVYNSQDSELVAALNKSKSLCRQYNNLDFSNVAARKVIIDELLQEEHNDGYCVFTPPFWCDYGFNVKVGKNFYSNHNLVILDCAEVTFGDNVFVGPNCGFYTAIHPIDAHQRNTGIELAKPIKVGSDVWFGGGVTVLPGVTINIKNASFKVKQDFKFTTFIYEAGYIKPKKYEPLEGMEEDRYSRR